jgi:hypothetical protein
MPRQEVQLPRRSRRHGVGKEIGGVVYVHRSYEHALGRAVATAKQHLPRDFDYTLVKWDQRSGSVSFIHSPDFDASPEPVVGDAWLVSASGKATFRRRLADPYIYHHKWLMVTDDYRGFDVEASKSRSAMWMVLEGVDRTRIGRQSYWGATVLPRLAACNQSPQRKG